VGKTTVGGSGLPSVGVVEVVLVSGEAVNTPASTNTRINTIARIRPCKSLEGRLTFCGIFLTYLLYTEDRAEYYSLGVHSANVYSRHFPYKVPSLFAGAAKETWQPFKPLRANHCPVNARRSAIPCGAPSFLIYWCCPPSCQSLHSRSGPRSAR